MKKNLLFLVLFFTLTNYGVCQFKIDSLGHVGMGTNYPNSGYRAHIKGNLLLSNYPETPWHELQLKIGTDGAFIGSTTGFIDFYTSYSGYNKLVARKFITHSQWNKAASENINGLEIIQGLNPIFKPLEKTKENKKDENGEYIIAPEGLLDLVPCVIQVDEDGYGVDYDQLIPILVSAIQEQQEMINMLAEELDGLKSNEQTDTNKLDENSNPFNYLYQNNPNPFNSTTTIGYCLQSETRQASIVIYDLNGAQLEEYPVSGKGKAFLSIEANKFKPGIYLYSLHVDNKLIDTKKMVITSY